MGVFVKIFQKNLKIILPIKIFFVPLRSEIKTRCMDKELNVNMEEVLFRKDRGHVRKKYKHDDARIGMYNYAGVLEMEFENLTDAVENNPVGATYKGILACVKHEIKKHAGKIWRKEGEE